MTVRHFLDGGGDVAARILTHDWAASPLGPIDNWPSPLKIAVSMLINSRFPKCLVWGPELTTIYNDAFRPILGAKPEALGRSFRDIWSEAWSEIGPIAERAFAGEATFIENFPLTVERNGYPEEAWFTFCYSPVRDESGAVVGIIDTVMETTQTVQAQKNARMVNAELAHRIKNTLAVISAIVNQSFRSASSLDEAHDTLSSRIDALGQAHAILTQSSWSVAPIRAVIEGALSPHRNDLGRIAIKGPPIELSAKQSLSLALGINELATNAVKYGCLHHPNGALSVTWSIENAGFRLVWRESGVPSVREPTASGFGTTLTKRTIEDQFGGAIQYDWRKDGPTVTIDAPLKAIVGDHA
ncbi:MAG: PAS domain-containing protein [Rhizobiales bacterium]|nr:PAS domain-containing protein [Hyphomicrobiales bacterium]